MALYDTSRGGPSTKYGRPPVERRQLDHAHTVLRSFGLSVARVYRVISAGEWGAFGDVYLYVDEEAELRECAASRQRILWDHAGWADK